MVDFLRVVGGGLPSEQLQTELEGKFNKEQSPGNLVNGRIVEAAITFGGTTVRHNLGRIPVGIIPVKLDAAETIIVISFTDQEMVLDTGAGNVSAKMWVF